jgi:hypothetical protein
MWHSAYCMFHEERGIFLRSNEYAIENAKQESRNGWKSSRTQAMLFSKDSTIALLTHGKTFIIISVL